jgi:transposase InsO family protein
VSTILLQDRCNVKTGAGSPWRTVKSELDVELTAQIEAVHRDSRGTYGSPRIHAELAAQGIHIGRKRVARLMRIAGLRGVSRRKCRTTVRDETTRPAPDLVDRQFTSPHERGTSGGRPGRSQGRGS